MSQKDIFGRHECLDRSSIITDMVDYLLVDHEGLTDEENSLAKDIYNKLFTLYQAIGARVSEENRVDD